MYNEANPSCRSSLHHPAFGARTPLNVPCKDVVLCIVLHTGFATTFNIRLARHGGERHPGVLDGHGGEARNVDLHVESWSVYMVYKWLSKREVLADQQAQNLTCFSSS